MSGNIRKTTREQREASLIALVGSEERHLWYPCWERWVETGEVPERDPERPYDGPPPRAVRVAAMLAEREAATEKAADLRWSAAMDRADWDGGVFHYEGRLYPWPRGFVPDCPDTWERKTREAESSAYARGVLEAAEIIAKRARQSENDAQFAGESHPAYERMLASAEEDWRLWKQICALAAQKGG